MSVAALRADHSRDMISDNRLPVDRGFEMWDGPLANYDNHAGLFLQRWLPHFCTDDKQTASTALRASIRSV